MKPAPRHAELRAVGDDADESAAGADHEAGAAVRLERDFGEGGEREGLALEKRQEDVGSVDGDGVGLPRQVGIQLRIEVGSQRRADLQVLEDRQPGVADGRPYEYAAADHVEARPGCRSAARRRRRGN